MDVSVGRSVQSMISEIRSTFYSVSISKKIYIEIFIFLKIFKLIDYCIIYKNHLFPFPKAPSIVVNSAGITRDNFLLKMDENSWNAVLNVNLKVHCAITNDLCSAHRS